MLIGLGLSGQGVDIAGLVQRRGARNATGPTMSNSVSFHTGPQGGWFSVMYQDGDIPYGTKLVLCGFELWSPRVGKGEWPTKRWFMDCTGFSDEQVKQALDRGTEMGYLCRIRRGGGYGIEPEVVYQPTLPLKQGVYETQGLDRGDGDYKKALPSDLATWGLACLALSDAKCKKCGEKVGIIQEVQHALGL